MMGESDPALVSAASAQLEDAARELVSCVFSEYAAEIGQETARVRLDFTRRGLLRSGPYLDAFASSRAGALGKHSLALADRLIDLGVRGNLAGDALARWVHETLNRFLRGQSNALLDQIQEEARRFGLVTQLNAHDIFEPLVAGVRDQVLGRARLRLAELRLGLDQTEANVFASGLTTGRQTSANDATKTPDSRRVAVVHGRNRSARDGLFAFLRALDLSPVEWDDAVRATGKGTPYNGEVVRELFQGTQAVVVLLTGDEQVNLAESLRERPDDDRTRQQARANVYFEAGMAFIANPDRTILVEVGRHDRPSDLEGLNVVHLDDTSQSRQRLRDRLQTAGCAVRQSGTDWLTAGVAELKRVIE